MKKYIILFLIVLVWAVGGIGVGELYAKKTYLYGYSDFLFMYGKKNNLEQEENLRYGFSQNRTNILVKSEFFQKWEFYFNVEFRGAFEMQVSQIPELDAIVLDSTGRLELEEAWTCFTLSEAFKVRVGQFHAPFGSFNAIQDMSPTYISVQPPLIYDDHFRDMNPISIIPDKANLELTGSIDLAKKLGLEYHIYFGNGLGSSLFESYVQSHFSGGGRLVFNYDNDFKIGFSTYFDTAYFDSYFFDTYLDFPSPNKSIEEKRALFAVDFDFTFSDFNINGEYILNHNKNKTMSSDRSKYEEYNRSFFYINLNFELIKNVRFYGEIDIYKDKMPDQKLRQFLGNSTNKAVMGLNFKPNWKTAIKAEIQYFDFTRGGRHKYANTTPEGLIGFTVQDVFPHERKPYTLFLLGLSVAY